MARTVVGHADRPPRGRGDARARGEEGFVRRAMRARTSLDPAAPSEESTAWSRTRRISGDASASPRSGAWVGSDSASRHTRARPGVVFSLDPRSRPRVASIAETGATGATRSEDETRSTARVQGTFRDVPPGRGWRAAARRQVNLNRALRAENDRFRLGPVSVASLVLSFLSIGLSRQMARTPSARRSGPVVREGSRGKSGRHTTGKSRSSAAAGPRADRAPRGGRGGARFDDAERGRRWRASDASRGRGRRGAGVVDARDGVARADARGGS